MLWPEICPRNKSGRLGHYPREWEDVQKVRVLSVAIVFTVMTLANAHLSSLNSCNQSYQAETRTYDKTRTYRQICLIRTDVDPNFLSGLARIRIMRIGITCIGKDRDLPICPV